MNLEIQQRDDNGAQKLSLHQFEMIGLLGEGSYAEVFEVRNVKTNKMGVLKKLYKDQILDQCKQNEVHVERYMLVNYSEKHPGIVKFQGSFQDEECIYFVLELCPFGDLSKIMKKSHANPSSDTDLLTRSYIFQLCSVVNFLHQQGITHLDIKPQNIVIDQNKNIKLIDFATCYFYDKTKQPQQLAKALQQAAKWKEVQYMKSQQDICQRSSFVGTPEYVSPEMLEHSKASKEADLWAIGCIIYEFYFGKPPFDAQSENGVFTNILTLNYCLTETSNIDIPEDVKDIVTKLLILNPQDRIGANNIDELFNHPYFDSVRTLPHWKQQMKVPSKCDVFFQIRSSQRLYSMTTVNFFGAKNLEASCDLEITSRTVSPTITCEVSPFDVKKPILEQNSPIIKQKSKILKLSNDSTDINSIKQKPKTQKLPHCIILLQGSWFWQVPKANILFFDKLNRRLVLNDFKKQIYLKISDQTIVKKIEKTYIIEKAGEYCIKFQNFDGGGIDWCVLIDELKNL